jgi:hypothetical protein
VQSYRTELEQLLASLRLTKPALKYEVVLSLAIFALFWGGFLAYSGTLTSGYHLIDDWELLTITESLQQSNVLTVIVDTTRTDLMIRFRPLFYAERVFALWVLGFNITGLSVIFLALAILTSTLLYLFIRKLGFGALGSFLFVLLTFVGHQAAIWWRVGTAEPFGMLWFALGLLFMAKVCQAGRWSPRLHTLVALAGFILAALTKEPFIVLLPVVCLAWVMLYYRHQDVSVFDAVRACAVPVITLAVTCAGALAAIFFITGTSTMGYVGVDSQSLSVRTVWETLKSLVGFSNGYWVIALLVVLAIVLLISLRNGVQFPVMVELACVALLVLLSTTSQAVIYAKSNITERYLIPGTLPLAFLVVYAIVKIEQLVKPRRLRLAISVLLVLGTILSLRTQFAFAWTDAKKYAQEGIALQNALERVRGSTRNDDVILVVADPARDYEGSISIREYLRILLDRKNVFVLPLRAQPEDSYSAFEKDLGSSYERDLGPVHFDKLADKSQIKAIFTYSHTLTDSAFRQNVPGWFDPAMFVRDEFAPFVVYTVR